MIYLTIFATSLVLISVGYFLYKKYKSAKGRNAADWAHLMQEFKARASSFKSNQELEEYLSSINENVKKHETDYVFLLAFNETIQSIRKKLVLDKKADS